jgi:hypothetical protein
LLALSATTAPAAIVKVDPAMPNSILLENFAAPSDASADLRNGVSFVSSNDGVATYRVAAQLDPQMFFSGYLDGLDFGAYPNVRLRHSFSASVKAMEASVYPMPVKAGQMGNLAVNNTLAGRQTTLETFPVLGEGLRLDPVDGRPTAGEYRIDYIILDRGRTLGFEFDQSNSTRGGINNFFVGYNLGGMNGKEVLSNVENGVYKGVPTSADPMMILQLTEATGLSVINPEVYKFIEIRMRVLKPSQGVATVFFRNESGDMSRNKIDIFLVNDEYFHTYLIDLRNDAAWNSGMITNFRFDPTSKAQAFEIDHIRFYETAVME